MTSRPDVPHPTWCSLAHCDADQGHADVRHSSEPIAWTAESDDVELEVALYRDDELDSDGRVIAQQHGLLLRMQNLAVGHADGTPLHGDVLLSEQDISRLEGEFDRFRRLSQG